jgi:hypothetical protein
MSRQPAVPRKFEDLLKRKDEYNIIMEDYLASTRDL